LEAEVKVIKEEDDTRTDKETAANKKVFRFGHHKEIVKNLKFGELPQIPY
jgi:hypothetical protein